MIIDTLQIPECECLTKGRHLKFSAAIAIDLGVVMKVLVLKVFQRKELLISMTFK